MAEILTPSPSPDDSNRAGNSPRTDPVVWLVLALGAIGLLAFARAGLLVRLPVPLNFNEGWNAYHTADVAAARRLYPDPPEFFFTNYPPLSFYVIAPVGRLLGDQMAGGRLIALLSLAAWIGLVAGVARRLRCSWTESGFGAAMLAVSMFVFNDFYVGVNDPQMLGHALQMLGLLFLLRDRRTLMSLAACAVLFAAGVFVKNNLIALPLAAVAWLLVVDRPNGWRLIALGAGVGAAGAAICVAAFGPQFAAQILWPRPYLPAKLFLMSWQWTGQMLLPLGIVAWLARTSARDRPGIAIAYAVTAIVTGLLFAGGDGVYWNTMFDADCALAIIAALALNRLTQGSSNIRRLVVPAAYLAAPALVLAMSATIHWLSPRFWFDPRWSEAAAARGVIAFMRQHDGPAMCEDLSICYWAGKPMEVDFFNLMGRAGREPWRIEALARRIERREFGVASVEAEPHGRDLGPRFREALHRHYRVDHVSQWGVLWVPK